MICPVCKLELEIERHEAELVLTWRVEDWTKSCVLRDRGDPGMCRNLLPTILKMLPKGKSSTTR
jgi:hypothetical protein